MNTPYGWEYAPRLVKHDTRWYGVEGTTLCAVCRAKTAIYVLITQSLLGVRSGPPILREQREYRCGDHRFKR